MLITFQINDTVEDINKLIKHLESLKEIISVPPVIQISDISVLQEICSKYELTDIVGSKYVADIFKDKGIDSVFKLVQLTIPRIMTYPNIGRGTANKINKTLKSKGLSLGIISIP